MEEKVLVSTHTHELPICLNADKRGFIYLIELYNRGKKLSEHLFELDFDKNVFIDINMLAALCHIIDKLVCEHNITCCVRIADEEIFVSEESDLTSTLIEKLEFKKDISIKIIQKYSADDKVKFKRELRNCLSISSLVDDYVNLLQSRISELFINIKRHARNKNSHFKDREVYFGYGVISEKIHIGIINSGVCIQDRILEDRKIVYDTNWEYIKKAMERGFSTKPPEENCGLGLYMINDLIKQTKSSLIIVSGNAYYSIDYEQDELGEVENFDFSGVYPGTCIILKINVEKSDLFFHDEVTLDNEVFSLDKLFGEE